ncbi:MAG TPA: flagellar biosynthetic protein FliR [Anaerolineales bacterium]|nr:flagellar biosynthetic protein FliR [Anaerolineales bacterium]HMZ05982.1 flagellar biosynthetic protein FliR [Anaerolineales bacterium]HNC88376.1 flagellar biosynthetic protein FliR [Anaerolineales bacterium]HND91532.1 flagellar biosynthetic protein FliR [Anaerolineales bacterium]HNF34800.1 flagellar biosynthetic protein FliR [Anaerolineales bacterium]
MTISVAQAQLFFLAFTRIMAILVHVPVFGGQNIPSQVRIGLGLVLAFVLLPWQPLPPEAAAIGTFAYSLAIGREILIGTLIGFAADLAFGAIQMAGAAMGTGSGFESSRIFNPALGESGSAFDQIFVMTATMIFLVINGHHLVLIAIQKTFEAVPLNGSLPFDGMETLLKTTSVFIAAGIHMAMPIIAALVLTDLTLGLLSRVAPQVQVYFLGLPVKVVVAMIAMSLTFSVIFPYVSSLFKNMAESMLLFVE